MTTREQVYQFNQEQGHKEPTKVTGHKVDTSKEQKRMTDEEWQEYWRMWEAMKEEEKLWWHENGKYYR